MGNFLLEYSLFAAKSLTIIVSIAAAIVFITSIIHLKKKHKEENYIEIEKINNKLENLKNDLESEIFSATEYKKIQKDRKKAKKLEEKAKAKSNKQTLTGNPNDENFTSKIFVINFNGDLHASAVENLREEISAILTVATKNDEVLVKIDSSGGIVHNYGFAASQLQRIVKNNIKLVVSVDLVAASGGYMMACVANKIIAAPFAIVGSIGVLAQLPNFHKLLKKHDIDIEHHTSGEYKTTLTTLAKNTDKGREKFIEELNNTHNLFKDFIKLHRPMVDLAKIATGEYWYASNALDLMLIDEIKVSDDYLMEKSQDHDIYSIEYKIHQSLKDKLTNALSIGIQSLLSKFSSKNIFF